MVHLYLEQKLFKSLVKQKYREMKDILIQKIVDSQEKKPEIFWKLLKNLKGNQNENRETSPTAMNEWETYFRSLHNVPLNNNTDKQFTEYIHSQLTSTQFQTKTKELDSPITNKEILHSIHKLKNKKACSVTCV